MTKLTSISQPLPYTSSPALLALQDLWLFLRLTFTFNGGLPSIILPIYPFRSGHLDELYPSARNILAISLHIILILTQSTFLILLLPSLFTGLPIPLLAFTPATVLIITGFVIGNNYFCVLLNGTKRRYKSIVKPEWEKRNEKWIFINGVAVGDVWMQANIDRLALAFRRPIFGIHNRTRGIIFDVVETIIQRTFGYATPDVRDVYASILQCLEAETNDEQVSETPKRAVNEEVLAGKDGSGHDKVVLILHSQGAVEGGLVLDWLYATLDQTILNKLEVYTFGSAANHFNSPTTTNGRAVKWIEHYANLGDYVARFGILHFRPLPKMNTALPQIQRIEEVNSVKQNGNVAESKNVLQEAGNEIGLKGDVGGYTSHEARVEIENRYVGRLFVRKGSGHQMNGNYLDEFFTMGVEDGELTEVLEENDFMSSEVNEMIFEKYDIVSKSSEGDYWLERDESQQRRRIKDMSRLWQYRNGRSPEDETEGGEVQDDGQSRQTMVQKNNKSFE